MRIWQNRHMQWLYTFPNLILVISIFEMSTSYMTIGLPFLNTSSNKLKSSKKLALFSWVKQYNHNIISYIVICMHVNKKRIKQNYWYNQTLKGHHCLLPEWIRLFHFYLFWSVSIFIHCETITMYVKFKMCRFSLFIQLVSWGTESNASQCNIRIISIVTWPIL